MNANRFLIDIDLDTPTSQRLVLSVLAGITQRLIIAAEAVERGEDGRADILATLGDLARLTYHLQNLLRTRRGADKGDEGGAVCR